MSSLPTLNSIGDVLVSMLTISVVDCEFVPQSDQTKDYKIGICCFSTKHAALRRKSKDGLSPNQDNVSESVGVTCLTSFYKIIPIFNYNDN